MSDEEKKAVEILAEKAAEEKIVEETQAEAAQAEEKLEEKTAERLETVLVKEESLDMSAETSSDSETSTPEKDSAEEEDDKDGPTPAEKKAEAKLEAEAKAKEAEEKGESTEDTETKAKEGDAGDSTEQEEVPDLSDAYYRAAIHRGWKKEDVDDFYKANPELAIRTFANIYEALNRSSKEFAALGRAYKTQSKTTDTTTTSEAGDTKPEFKSIDIDALRKDYPNDPIIDLVESQQTQSKLLFDEVQSIKGSRPAQKTGQPSGIAPEQERLFNQEVAAIEQQIESFFRSDELKGYEDFYGDLPTDAVNWDALTPGQKMNRWTVIEMMDDMLAGASTHGRDMKNDEALRLAHSCVTESLKEKVIRDKIKDSVTTRSKSLTLKPSSSAKTESTKPQTGAELEVVTAERLGKLSW